MEDISVTFFTGATLDKHTWVISYEGGPTATEPYKVATARGMIKNFSLPNMSIEQVSLLKVILSQVEIHELDALVRHILKL